MNVHITEKYKFALISLILSCCPIINFNYSLNPPKNVEYSSKYGPTKTYDRNENPI